MSLRILEDQFISPCPCPRTLALVLVLEPQILVLGPQSPEKLSRTSHSANSPLCMITWSINLVTTTVHEVTVKNGLLTDINITYSYMSVSKLFFAVTQCCCPQGKSLSSMIHKDQFTSPYPSSSPCPCTCPETFSP